MTGNGIASITKTSTSGLVDTYTITYTNGNTTTFTITNGEDGEVTETELDVLRQKVANQQKVINQLPQVTGQGTEITLEDTIEAPFTEFDVEGNSTQETTEGRQLLDFSNPSSQYNSNSSFSNDVFTSNGTGNYAYTGFNITALYKSNIGKVLRFDYSAIDYSNTGDNNVLVMLVVNNENYYGLLSKNSQITHIIPADVSNVTTAQVRFYSNNTSDTSNHSLKITKPILHFGADEQDYEKYTGRTSLTKSIISTRDKELWGEWFD